MSLIVAKEDTGNAYAREGTAAHALAEVRANYEIVGGMKGSPGDLLAQWASRYGKDAPDQLAMFEHIDSYLAFLRDRLADNPMSTLLLEQKLPTGVPSCWGTSDAIIVSPTHIEVVDLKYGQGVAVDAAQNTQLMLYGVGALEAYGDLLGEVKTVRLTIFQPRVSSVPSSWEIQAAELRAWRDSIIPIAEEALGDNARFGPSEEACRWCPVAGDCRARMEAATSHDFGRDIDLLSPEEISEALGHAQFIRQWLDSLESTALEMAYNRGVPVPGYKVVASGSRRIVIDEDGLRTALAQMAYPTEAYTKTVVSTVGIGELEKLLKKDFDVVAGPYVARSPGRPSLVPESDRRQAINVDTEAAKDFS